MLMEIKSGTDLISGSFSFSSYFEVDDGVILRLREGNHSIILRERNHTMKCSGSCYTNCWNSLTHTINTYKSVLRIHGL